MHAKKLDRFLNCATSVYMKTQKRRSIYFIWGNTGVLHLGTFKYSLHKFGTSFMGILLDFCSLQAAAKTEDDMLMLEG